MAKILFVSDIHIGIRYSYRVDYKTGISDRTLDFINALARVVEFARREQIDIFVISGDLFDRVAIGPTLLELVREKIWKPLIESEIPIIIVGGNHDSPQILEKGSPFGEISIIPNSFAIREPQKIKIKIKSKDEEIGFILLPYMTATQVITYVEKIMGEEIIREEQMVRAQEFFQEIIGRFEKNLDTEKKIIVGHFYVQGSKIGVIPYPDRIPHEFVIKKDMLPINDIDLAVFGHIHTTQTLYDDKVLIPGSLERVNIAERNEDKGFYIFDTDSNNLEFISSNPRTWIKKSIEVPSATENPTDAILENIPQNIDDSILHLEIKISPLLKEKVLQRRILPYLEQKTFNYKIVWKTTDRVRDAILPEFVLNPLELFSSFVTEHYKDYPHYEKLLEKGLEILDTALSKVEEEK